MVIGRDLDCRMFRRQKYVMIEFLSQFKQAIPQSNKVDHILILVQRTSHITTDAIVVTVDPLTDIPIERDKVSRRKNQLLFLQRNPVARLSVDP